MCGKNRAFGRGVSRHRGNFLQLQAGHEHWRWRNAAPAVEFPTGSKEFDLRAEGDVENHLGGAAIELLRELKKRRFPKSWPSGEPQRETSRDSCSICSVTVRVQKKVRETVSEMSSGAPSPFDSSRVSAGMRENSRGTVEFPSCFSASVAQRNCCDAKRVGRLVRVSGEKQIPHRKKRGSG